MSQIQKLKEKSNNWLYSKIKQQHFHSYEWEGTDI